ncbi:MAG: hypothetical protein ACM3NH_00015 [Candidatus Saccharibacteria bacterium]
MAEATATVAQKQDQQNLLDYALSYEAPLELYFLKQKQKDQLEKEKAKLESTVQYVTAVLENPEIDQDLDRAVAEGKIYSPAMTANIRSKIRVVYDGMGNRADLSRCLVSETGQFVLMSENCASKLKIFTDDYLTKDQIGGLISVLSEEGLPKDRIERVKQAAAEHGAIILQRGAFEALRGMLEEALAIEDVRQSYDEFKHRIENQDKAMDMEAPKKDHGTTIDELKSRLSPQPKAPAMTPQEIKREVATKEIGDGQAPAQPRRPEPARPAPVELNLKPQEGLKSLDDVKTIDDLKRVEPAHLRQAALPDQIKKLKAKIVYLAAVNKQLPVFALSAFEQSPLFRQYLKIGGAAITGGDTKAGYIQVMTKLKDAGEDVINLYEFEAIADLRKEMERL